ncbi:WhiB family transcriptional regulator [Zhihengliuella flava]|uniref:Transcriptional regulator WhiB n=1 Tax=Zhihengliuella flava TaxID=1285193 RepID=A0A931GED4_9MICC|nr:WhiB family transcriptional regulator [Zhihengliuella flava]MBG6083975.1 WhiB family redox-sensing transcriptional regulator [Zhihengliuella flava]
MGTPERIYEHSTSQAQASKHYGSRGVPGDWFLDPADDAAAERFREASEQVLEESATAFLAAHEEAEAGSDSAEPEALVAPLRQAPAESGQQKNTERELWLGLVGYDEDEGELGWQTEALCAQTDPEAFFPEKGGSTRDAKKVCGACNVRSECLEYALANDERFGIWGGLSERERRRLRKRAV